MGATLVAAFCFETIAPSAGQTAPQTESASGTLPPVLVSPPPKKKLSRDDQNATRGSNARRRTAIVHTPRPDPSYQPKASDGSSPTPLNSNAVASSASRLGLAVRDTPATVEVVGDKTIQERGCRTVSDVAQGAVGVTSGDNPAEPSATRALEEPQHLPKLEPAGPLTK